MWYFAMSRFINKSWASSALESRATLNLQRTLASFVLLFIIICPNNASSFLLPYSRFNGILSLIPFKINSSLRHQYHSAKYNLRNYVRNVSAIFVWRGLVMWSDIKEFARDNAIYFWLPEGIELKDSGAYFMHSEQLRSRNVSALKVRAGIAFKEQRGSFKSPRLGRVHFTEIIGLHKRPLRSWSSPNFPKRSLTITRF